MFSNHFVRPDVGPKVAKLSFFVCALFLTGCHAPNKSISGVTPREVQPFVIRLKSQDFLRSFAERKQSIHPDRTPRVYLCDELDVRGLPQGAPSPEAMLEKAFTDLSAGQLVYLPRDKKSLYFAQNGRPTAAFVDFYRLNVLGQPASETSQSTATKEVPSESRNEATSPPDPQVSYATIRGQIFIDQVVYTLDRGLNLRALIGVENGQKFIEPDLDITMGAERSTLRLSLWITDPQGFVTRHKSEVQVDIVKDVKSERFALLFYGSGGNDYQKISSADGLGAAIQTVVAHGLVVLLGRQIGVDYWRCGVGGEIDPNVRETIGTYSELYKSYMSGEMLQSLGYLRRGEAYGAVQDGRLQLFPVWHEAAQRFWIDRRREAEDLKQPNFLDQFILELMAAFQPSRQALAPLNQLTINGDKLDDHESENLVQALWSRPGVQSVTPSVEGKKQWQVAIKGSPQFFVDSLRNTADYVVEDSTNEHGQLAISVLPIGDVAVQQPKPALKSNVFVDSQRTSAPKIEDSEPMVELPQALPTSRGRSLRMPADAIDFGFELTPGDAIILSNGIDLRFDRSRTNDIAEITVRGESVSLPAHKELGLEGRNSRERLVVVAKWARADACSMRAYIQRL